MAAFGGEVPRRIGLAEESLSLVQDSDEEVKAAWAEESVAS